MTLIRSVSTEPVELNTGRVLAMGETDDVDLEHPHNAALLEQHRVVLATPSEVSVSAVPSDVPTAHIINDTEE